MDDQLPRPTLLYPFTISSFISYLLSHHGSPTTLVVCMAREQFLLALLNDLPHTDPLLQPTLHLLAACESITMVFCPAVPSLLAFLATYPSDSPIVSLVNDGMHSHSPTLALLSPLQLHADSPSHSAQGISRTLASAVEASIRARQRLIVVEPYPEPEAELESESKLESQLDIMPEQLASDARVDSELIEIDDLHGQGEDMAERLVTWEQPDPWDEHLPILNVTGRRFAAAGESAWVGRTVKAKDVLRRWFVLERVGD